MNSIRKYRELAGLTQLQLSDELKVSVITISRYENNDRVPRWTEISAMCKTLSEKIGQEVTPGELMSNPQKTPSRKRSTTTPAAGSQNQGRKRFLSISTGGKQKAGDSTCQSK